LTTKNRTKEEKNISKIVLLGSTITIILVSFTLAFVLIKLQVKEFKTHLETFKKTIIQREKFTIKSAIQNLKEDILYEQKAQNERLKQSIKNQTMIAKKVAQLIYKNSKNRDRDSILGEIKRAIQNISIDKDGIDYFIFDKHGTYLLNTKDKSYEGENFIGFKDLNGKEFIKDMIKKSKTENSFESFLWYIPHSSKIRKKITYTSYIYGLDIIIGSGKYLQNSDEIEKYLIDKLKKRELNQDEFLLVYRIGSLSEVERYSTLLLAKNIKASKQTLAVVNSALEKSNYMGNTFLKKRKMLLYSTFFTQQRLFLAFGVNLKHINKIIDNETAVVNQNLHSKIVSLILSITLITLVFFILSYFIAKKIEKVFKIYRLKVINNERKYQLLFNHSNDGFIISKITDKNTASIVSTNSVAKMLSGFGVDLIGMNFFELFEQFDKKRLFLNNEILDSVVLVTKQKSKRNIELSCVLFDHNGEKLLFSSLRDISERVALKVEKQKQEKLLIQKSKMASMGEMIGNIAHQWRQPISELSGLFFDIESAYDYGELNKKYLSKRIDEANDLVEYMSKTIDDFKEFYNPNSKKEIFSLKRNLEKTIAIIGSSFKYHNIKIEINIDEDIEITGFSNEFSQVLLNILSNSKETALMRDIKDAKVKIYSVVKNEKISLHVEDNCGGIEDEIIDKIFEPYFTTKYNYGTGIGLYMSKIIIENKMGGKIVVKNIEDKGARFTIIL